MTISPWAIVAQIRISVAHVLVVIPVSVDAVVIVLPSPVGVVVLRRAIGVGGAACDDVFNGVVVVATLISPVVIVRRPVVSAGVIIVTTPGTGIMISAAAADLNAKLCLSLAGKYREDAESDRDEKYAGCH